MAIYPGRTSPVCQGADGWSLGGRSGTAWRAAPRHFLNFELTSTSPARRPCSQRYAEAIRRKVWPCSPICGWPRHARHIAAKLARHFIADGTTAAVEQLARTSCAHTGGDLTAVYTVLIDLPQSWM